MSRTSVAILCMFAALAVAARVASWASALEWLTGGTSLFTKATKSEALRARAETAQTLVSTLSGGAKVLVLCGAVEFNTATIREATAKAPTDSVDAVEYGECELDEPSSCSIAARLTTQEVRTAPFEEDLVKGKKEVWDLFEPAAGAGEPLINFVVSGADCSGEGIYKVKGTACAKKITAGDALTLLWEFGEPLAECALKFGVNPAKPEGSAEISSVTAATWGTDL